jgi:hypothetical protein
LCKDVIKDYGLDADKVNIEETDPAACRKIAEYMWSKAKGGPYDERELFTFYAIVSHFEKIGGLPDERFTVSKLRETREAADEIIRRWGGNDSFDHYRSYYRDYVLDRHCSYVRKMSEDDRDKLEVLLQQLEKRVYSEWKYTIEHGTICSEKFIGGRDRWEIYLNDGWKCNRLMYGTTPMIGDYEPAKPNIRIAKPGPTPPGIPSAWKLSAGHQVLERLINELLWRYDIKEPPVGEYDKNMSAYFMKFLSPNDKKLRFNKIVLDCVDNIQVPIGRNEIGMTLVKGKTPIYWIPRGESMWYHYPRGGGVEEFKLIQYDGQFGYYLEQLTYVDGQLTKEVLEKSEKFLV